MITLLKFVITNQHAIHFFFSTECGHKYFKYKRNVDNYLSIIFFKKKLKSFAYLSNILCRDSQHSLPPPSNKTKLTSYQPSDINFII